MFSTDPGSIRHRLRQELPYGYRKIVAFHAGVSKTAITLQLNGTNPITPAVAMAIEWVCGFPSAVIIGQQGMEALEKERQKWDTRVKLNGQTRPSKH